MQNIVPVSAEQKTQLDQRVSEYVSNLMQMETNSPEFTKQVDTLTSMGRKEIELAASHSNRFLDRPVRAMEKTTGVSTNLTELRRTVEGLDPARKGNLLAPRKLLGIIPFGNKLKGYFDSYSSAQTHISTILARLDEGKQSLEQDNQAVDVERQNMWKALGKLEQMIHMSSALDAEIEARADELDLTDSAKAKVLRDTALFYVRQRHQDLLTQLAVTAQGYMALELVKKNNIELIKGVDRASTTTVSALRTAVTVAQAVTSQKLVLNQITALNTTTANIIDSTGNLLRSNTAAVHEQAASATIPLETLKRAFQNIYDTMDSIDTFKLKALEGMKQNVQALEHEVGKANKYIAASESTAGSPTLLTSVD